MRRFRSFFYLPLPHLFHFHSERGSLPVEKFKWFFVGPDSVTSRSCGDRLQDWEDGVCYSCCVRLSLHVFLLLVGVVVGVTFQGTSTLPPSPNRGVVDGKKESSLHRPLRGYSPPFTIQVFSLKPARATGCGY